MSGCSSEAERDLAKVDVEGSIPFGRSKRCLTCEFWYPPTPLDAVTTETRGWCFTIGSPYDEPTPDQGCNLWREDPHEFVPRSAREKSRRRGRE